MPTPKYNPTFIRKWRQFRGYTLRELEERMLDRDGNPVITHVSIGRIETGKQPYTQPVLEAIAKALETEPHALLSRRPGEDLDIMPLWDKLDAKQKEQALTIISTLCK